MLYGSLTTTFNFNEKRREAEIETLYYGARYYDTMLRQFISVDPLRLEGVKDVVDRHNLLQPYVYAAADPVTLTDDGNVGILGGFLQFYQREGAFGGHWDRSGKAALFALAKRTEIAGKQGMDMIAARAEQGASIASSIIQVGGALGAMSELPAVMNALAQQARALEKLADAFNAAAGPAAKGVSAVASTTDKTTLFRAVSGAEFAQVMKTGAFEAGPNSLGGKFLAGSAADAAKWGEALNGAGNFKILQVELPTSTVDHMMYWQRLDAIGPAWYGELHQLTGATITPYVP